MTRDTGCALSAAVPALELARALSIAFDGSPSQLIGGVGSLATARPTFLGFTNDPDYRYGGTRPLIAPPTASIRHHLVSNRPRYDFARAVAWLVEAVGVVELPPAAIHSSASVARTAHVDAGVVIGPGTVIAPGAVILSRVRIGADCHIGPNTVIGTDGFGYERDAEGVPFKFPHLGGVRIGDRVEVGANAAIDRGSLDDTRIGDDCKIDNLVHVAHNCDVGARSYLIAAAQLGGSVTVGEDVWVGPQVAMKQKVRIGDGATVGVGAVVIRDVAGATVVAGNPARLLTGGASNPPRNETRNG